MIRREKKKEREYFKRKLRKKKWGQVQGVEWNERKRKKIKERKAGEREGEERETSSCKGGKRQIKIE